MSNGQAMQAIELALQKSNYNVLGIHSHIGSQIFETAGFVRAIEVLRQFFRSSERANKLCSKSAKCREDSEYATQSPIHH